MKILVLKDINSQPSDYLLHSIFDVSSFLNVICLEDLVGQPEKNGLELHRYLYNEGGLSKGVLALSMQELFYDVAIGFSAGGFLLWKTCQNISIAKHVVCVSATRLRHESRKPNANITLIYGSKDEYAPSRDQAEFLSNNTLYLPDESHDSYKEVDSEMYRTVKVIVSNMEAAFSSPFKK